MGNLFQLFHATIYDEVIMNHIQTNFLKLIKPIAGTTNWGGVVNQNFDKIDLEYSKMLSTIQGIAGQMNEVGTFSFLISSNNSGEIYEADYAVFGECGIKTSDGFYYTASTTNGLSWTLTSSTQDVVLNNNNTSYGSILMGTLTEDKTFLSDTSEKYAGAFYNDHDSDHKQLMSLPDFIAFYLHIPSTSPEVTINTVYAFGKEWKMGDLLIKSSQLIENERQVLIMKFKQSLGGYYLPSSTVEQPNNITFTKTPANIAEETVDIFIPRCVSNSVETVQSLSSTSTKVITNVVPSLAIAVEGQMVNYEQRLAYIQFFTGESNNRSMIYMPYSVAIETIGGVRQWVINIKNTYAPKEYMVSYVILQSKP